MSVPPVSRPLVRLFSRYARGYVRRHLHAVRVLAPPPAAVAPSVVVMNHPSWWDPMIGVVLKDRYFADREHYAPIEAAALSKYRFFARLGFFGIEPGTPRGAAAFLETASAVASRPRATLWITAQGRFADPRERPASLMRGIGALARRVPDLVVLPLALEYPFWDERTPEALAAFGEPVATAGETRTADEWTSLVASRLEAAQDALAAAARARNAAAFETILGGTAGVGGVYDLWRALAARWRGERFDASHGGRR